MTDKLIIFDTTLRDGEQSPGASMTKDEKLRIARQLERLEVDVIEAGFAASSNGDFEAVKAIAHAIKDSTVCSLARANDRDISRAAEALKGAANRRASTSSSPPAPLHMEKKLRMTPEQVFEQAKLVGPLRAQPERRRRVLARGRLPLRPRLPVPRARSGDRRRRDHDQHPRHRRLRRSRALRRVHLDLRERIPNSDKAVWSVHCHNDLGMAVANSLAGVKIGGARQVECTINGLGERAGNCSLEEIVMAVKTRKRLLRARARHRRDADRAGVAPGLRRPPASSSSRTRRWSAPTPSRTPRASTRTACSRRATPTRSCAPKTSAGRPTRSCSASCRAATPSSSG